MKKITFTLLLAFVLAFAGVENAYTNSGGAPGQRTGAPGETTCTNCHGGTVNSGAGNVLITFNGGNTTTYMPGQTYPITVTVTDAAAGKFGFKITALKPDNTAAGTFSAGSSSARVQLNTISGRNYVTHKAAGNVPVNGKGEWVFDWVAPAAGVGTVSFYVAGMGANGDGDSGGDLVYTSNKQVALSNVSAESEAFAQSISVFPNPTTAAGSLGLGLQVPNADMLHVSLFDLQGRQIAVLYHNFVGAGAQVLRFSLPDGLSKGIYLTKINLGGKLATKSVVVQ